MKLNNLLHYLLEVKRPSKKIPAEPPEVPEGYKNPPLGQYLFAPVRNDVPVPKEINTDDEQKMMKDLGSHFGGEGSVGEIEQSLTTLKNYEQQGLYTKLLKPPSGLAYRFMSDVRIEMASSMFLNGLPVETIIATPNKAICVEPIGMVENPGAKSTVGRGATKAASWTISPATYNFGDFTSTRSGYVAILLVANIDPEKFLLNPDSLANYAQEDSRIFDASLIKSEREVISLGPVDVLKAAYIYVQAKMPSHLQNTVFASLPRLSLPPDISKEILSKELFTKQFEYVEDCIAEHKGMLTIKQLKYVIDSKHYKFLKLGAEQGINISSPEDQNTIAEILYPNIFDGTIADPKITFDKGDIRNVYSYLRDAGYETLRILIDQIRLTDTYNIENSALKAGANTQIELLRALDMKAKFKKPNPKIYKHQ
jgi:hypothetical protein